MVTAEQCESIIKMAKVKLAPSTLAEKRLKIPRGLEQGIQCSKV
ncbi:hypothetical protein Hdeb2414_s0025g00659061 [Helianthus debilis subsp. tardiflorus]